MTMGWSRACYVELAAQSGTAAFIQCHVNAFEYLGGVPRRCLYDNAKVITRREETADLEPACWTSPGAWVLRLGCASLTEPRPARWTAGSSTCGAPSIRNRDADLNHKGWSGAANARVHGTTHRRGRC